MDEQQVRQIAQEEIAKAIRFILTEVDATTQNRPQNTAIPEIPADLQKYVVIEGTTVKVKEYIKEKGVWEKINESLKTQGYHWVTGDGWKR